MLKISSTEKKSNQEVGAYETLPGLVESCRKRQVKFSGHAMKSNASEKLFITGKIEGTKARGRQRMKYLDSLGICWPNDITPLELIRATEDRELWKHVTAPTMSLTLTIWHLEEEQERSYLI